MCTNFIECPAFGDQIMGKSSDSCLKMTCSDHLLLATEACVSDAQLKKQIAILYFVVILDILTDVLRKPTLIQSSVALYIDCTSHLNPCPLPLECADQPPPQNRSGLSPLSQHPRHHRQHHPRQRPQAQERPRRRHVDYLLGGDGSLCCGHGQLHDRLPPPLRHQQLSVVGATSTARQLASVPTEAPETDGPDRIADYADRDLLGLEVLHEQGSVQGPCGVEEWVGYPGHEVVSDNFEPWLADCECGE